ncbi:MAG: alpha/beta hydrolase [Clostridiales Family XIII bacterium]|jgi:pimeloyl-ACP methyl ester carboxylesterase|nr:alpha/beta hydrolase [Clostridiales Family XIII bacterium]
MPYFTTSDNCKIYYEESGTGEHIVFIHGWTATAAFFKSQTDYFSNKYHVIAYDARGHGRSDRGEITERNMRLSRLAEDLHELIESLGLNKVNLVGWSMGTSTLLAYVRAFGCQYVNKICLIDMTPKVVSDNEWKLGTLDAKQTIDFLALAVQDWDLASDFFLPLALVNGFPKDSERYRLALAEMRSNTPHAMIYFYIAIASEDFRPVLKDITVPVLLTYSGNGLLCGPAHGEYMAQNIKNSKLVVFPDCGHGLFMDDPVKFNTELETFLTEL